MKKIKYPHRGEFEVTEQMAIVEVGGYKFFRGQKSNDFQCATCLNLMGLLADEERETAISRKGIRKIKLTKDCDCPPQE